jgi:hypothetical protein
MAAHHKEAEQHVRDPWFPMQVSVELDQSFKGIK